MIMSMNDTNDDDYGGYYRYSNHTHTHSVNRKEFLP